MTDEQEAEILAYIDKHHVSEGWDVTDYQVRKAPFFFWNTARDYIDVELENKKEEQQTMTLNYRKILRAIRDEKYRSRF